MKQVAGFPDDWGGSFCNEKKKGKTSRKNPAKKGVVLRGEGFWEG